MSRFHLMALAAVTALFLQSCSPPSVGSGSSSGELADGVSAGTAPYALLELSTGTVTYRASLSDAATNPAYRFNQMVFRRVGPAGANVFVGIYEVTQAQWGIISSIGPGFTQPWLAIDTSVVQTTAYGNTNPAYNISYDELAIVLAGYTPATRVRLAAPTSAQWEAAVGTSTGYSWGATAARSPLAAQAVVRETVLDATTVVARTGGSGLVDSGGPLAVGSRSPSSQGIYDIHGNVWEWTAGGTEVRGGSWYDAASLARAEVRAGAGQGLAADVDHALIGARLVLLP